LVPIPAQGIGMRDAHVAAPVWAGSGVPFVRLVYLCGPLDVIGRRTRPRLIDDPTGIRGYGPHRTIYLAGQTGIDAIGKVAEGFRTQAAQVLS
jgi:hypothetical protein